MHTNTMNGKAGDVNIIEASHHIIIISTLHENLLKTDFAMPPSSNFHRVIPNQVVSKPPRCSLLHHIRERPPFSQWLWTDCKVFDAHRPVVAAKRFRVAHVLANQNAGWDNRWSAMCCFTLRLTDGEASDWSKPGASKPRWLVHAVRRSLQYFRFIAYCWISCGEKN